MVASQSALFLVRLPSEIDRPVQLFEELLKSIHGQFSDSTISLELACIKKHLYFFVSCERTISESIVAAIYAHYPFAEIEEVQDYLALDVLERGFALCDVRLSTTDIFPIKTYKQFEGDSMSALCSAFLQLDEEESAWIHIILTPREDRWSLNFERSMKVKMNAVGSYVNPANYFRVQSLKDFRSKRRDACIEKASQHAFKATIRIGTTSVNNKRAQERLAQLSRAFSFYNQVNLNSLKPSKSTRTATHIDAMLRRSHSKNQSTFAIDECTTLYHYPRPTDIPHIVHVITKKAQAPEDLPREKTHDENLVSLFGVTNFHNEYEKFGLLRSDRRRHTYLLGKSGTGKSKLMELLINEDVRAGHGVCLIDPHGDLIDSVLRNVPPERVNDVVVFNPADVEFPIGFNVLAHTPEDKRIGVASGFIDILKKLFKEQWNSRLEHITRFAVLAALERSDSTIVTVLKLLTDESFRTLVVSELTDELVKSYWINEFPEIKEKYSQETIMPLVNKIGQFIASPLIRNIVSQPENKLNLAECMKNNKIILIRISKGNLGEENVALLGSMIITKLYHAALERSQIPENERRDFYLYCDEFQYFATETFAEILSEARKFRFCVTMAHQYLGQLSPAMRSTIIGNVGTLISFRVGSDDAHILENEFTPVFKARDVMNLGVREFYIKTSIEGELRNAFSGRTLNVTTPHYYLQDNIIALSRAQYATPRAEVEHLIFENHEKNVQVVENTAVPATEIVQEILPLDDASGILSA